MMRCFLGALCALGTLALAGCDQEEADTPEEIVRAIKYVTLDRRAGQQERRIAGVVAASVTSNVAFEVSGQIIELTRQTGDQVNKGDLLARLDPEPYLLEVSRTSNALAQSTAELNDTRSKFEQQSRLFDQGFATQTAYDSAEAAFRNAEGSVGVAQSQLEIAQRDVAKTDLLAPFDGVIASRPVEVFEEVTTGQSIYALQTSGQDKVEASLPETLINIVSLGDEAQVQFPPLGGATVPGFIDEIAPLTGDANAYPIKIRLETIPPGLRPGMSAELIFQFSTEATGEAWMLPLGAIKPQVESQDEGSVFVYEPETKTLSERDVTVVNVRGNELEVMGDLQEGEVVATAGISFLHEGMTVTLFDPTFFE